MYRDIRDRNSVFNGMFCSSEIDMRVTFEGGAERAVGEFVSGNYFRVRDVGAAAGRLFSAQDDLQQGGHPVAVLEL